MGFLFFRYSQALQTSSQIQEEEDEWRRHVISEETRREELDSQNYSPEAVPREVSQKKKNEHQKKNKQRSRTWGHDDMINLWSQCEVLFNVKHPNYLDKNCRINALNRISEALKEQDLDFSAEEISKMHSLRVYFSAQRNKLISSKRSGAGTEDVHKTNWPFYEPLMFLSDNLVSCVTKTNMTHNDLTSDVDIQEWLYDTEGIGPSKKEIKKCDAFKNSQANDLIREATNTLQNLNEVKSQHSPSKTADDMFCEMIAVHLKTMSDGAAKEFLKLDIYRAVITAIHHNGGSHNATVPVPQVGNLSSFAGGNFGSPPMTPTIPHINQTNFSCGQK